MGNFYTDVISQDERFSSVKRVSDASLLEPATRELVAAIVSAAHRMGIELMIYETYRCQDRQQELFNQGATKLRTVGVHHYGLACDIVRVVAGEPSWKGDFSFLGQLAQSSGMIWGGDWGTPHIKHSFVHNLACAALHGSQARGSFRRHMVSGRGLQSIPGPSKSSGRCYQTSDKSWRNSKQAAPQ